MMIELIGVMVAGLIALWPLALIIAALIAAVVGVLHAFICAILNVIDGAVIAIKTHQKKPRWRYKVRSR
jgi:hypothetical protein